VMKHLENIE
jgi:chemotaxis protein MotB